MQESILLVTPKISNVVCTADLSQFIDLTKLQKFGWAIYDQAIYSGICAYIKLSGMHGKVSVFSSGKLISVGGKTISEARKKLFQARHLMVESNLISNTKITPKVVNIVATLNLGRVLNLEKISRNLEGSIYEPERFSAVIQRDDLLPTCLIFASGKIVIIGSQSEEELLKISSKIQNKLNS